MPTTPHIETHFTATETVRDIVIGMADGLTVPFALAAGLSGAVASTSIVVTAGLAEIAAGSIAMGLGGYLAAKTDVEHYAIERMRELRGDRACFKNLFTFFAGRKGRRGRKGLETLAQRRRINSPFFHSFLFMPSVNSFFDKFETCREEYIKSIQRDFDEF